MAKRKYDPVIDAQLLRWMMRSGLTQKQASFQLGIKIRTFTAWVKKYPEFSEALKEGRDYCDSLVEDALLKRARGFEVVILEEKEGEKGYTKTTTKYYAPDTAAIIFWLKNRRPDSWRDVRQLDLDMTNKSTDELLDEAKELTKLVEGAKGN